MIAEVAVIGGGLAGAALATRAAAGGMRALLIEREPGPHDKVCGEFLSREAVLHLRALELEPLALGGASIGRLRLATGGMVTETTLPFEGIGLSRRVLDEALLARAAHAGATVLRGRAVASLQPHASGHRLRLQGGAELDADHVVLATGKHDLRGWRRGTGRQNDLIGFKQHLRLAPSQRRALEGTVELMLFRGGYAGLQLVEAGQATLCLLIRRARLAELGGRWERVLSAAGADVALLRRRLDGAEPVQARPLTVAGIPYGYVARAADTTGIWRLGDQSAVIPSFTGDGMSIALHSAALAARLLRDGAAPPALQAVMRADVGRQVGIATRLSQGAVYRPLQRPALLAARWLPFLPSGLAAATRIPEAAMRRGLAAALA